MRINKSLWLVVLAGLAIVLWAGSRGFGDPAVRDPSTYSGKGSTSVGAWYDEIWQAGSFFRLERDPVHNDEFRYERTSTPETAMHHNPPVFRQGNSTIPQDMVVTQWKVSGHVHFASSGM